MSAADAFTRLRDQRLPRAVKQLKLIGNLARYPHQVAEGLDLIERLQDALNEVDARFAQRRPAATPTADFSQAETPPAAAAQPPGDPDLSHGLPGEMAQSYAAWALDKLNSGETEEAAVLLRRALKQARDA